MKKKAQMVEAVLFFNERGLCKEMLFPEFEAVLDGVVNLPEFAGEQIRAVYVLIDGRLMVRSAVFFYLDFNDDGSADSGWNIPLRNLSERGGRGPDMGAGPIRLVCRRQCPVSWHQMHLWDPEFTPGNNHLVQIRDRLRGNPLGLIVEDEVPDPVPAERLHVAAEERWYPAGAASDTPRMASLEATSVAMPEVERQVEAQHRRRLEEAEQAQAVLQAQLDALQAALDETRHRNEQLLAEQQAQGRAFRKVRDELIERLRQGERQAQANLEAQRARTEQEAQSRVVALAEEYQRRIAELQAEVARLDRQLFESHLERDRLLARCEELERREADNLLEKLAAQGMVFVVYHPGAGQLTVPLHDLARYQADPLAYAAARCSVSAEDYRAWLDHYMRPACDAKLLNGDRCAMPIDRVEVPSRFIPGVSNCCARHRGERALRTVG